KHFMHPSQPALLDARALSSVGGISRVTQHIVAGLRELDRPGFDIVLWGDPHAIGDLPDWCRVHPSLRSGVEWYGQRKIGAIPPHSGGIYLEQIRPLRDWKTATIIYDTIQLRAPSAGAIERRARTAFLRHVAQRSGQVLTVSEHARRSIEDDLGCHANSIRRVRLPMDGNLAAKVRSRRRQLALDPAWSPDDILFVGQMSWHKNVEGLLRSTAAAAPSCTLRIFGARPGERDKIHRMGAAAGVSKLDVVADTTEESLISRYANARVLVLPSFEEGWGLPVWEAIACGIPVISSTGGSLPELESFSIAPFRCVPVGSVDNPIDHHFAAAISDAASAPAPDPAWLNANSIRALENAPTQAELANEIIDAITRTRT
ncbi:MAG: glycosyltransferase involved in cell wall biosynthesis, partial [Candidatus Azotimanducaceae bacterium]